MSESVVMVCGSRALPTAASPLVADVVWSLLAGGSQIVTGCAVGADAVALSAAVSAGVAARVSVFAAFGPVSPSWAAARYSAPGAWSGSAVAEVAAAMLAGASVRWWSGGPASVPLRARLAARSLAGVRATAAGGPGSGLVAFVAQLAPRPFASGAWPSCGSGSWASAAAAARLGLPVVVFPVGPLVGVSLSSLPLLPGWGAWSPVVSGVLAGGFRWSSVL